MMKEVTIPNTPILSASIEEVAETSGVDSRIHSRTLLFSCSSCEYRCNTKLQLKLHYTVNHTGEKPHKCDFCSFATAWKSSLNIHSRIHTGDLPFSCSSCEYKCNRKQQLTAHTAKHTGDKPFTCDVCSYSTARKGDLKVHSMIHARGDLKCRPYKCQICRFATTTKVGLTRHTRLHTGDMPFSCSSCDYKCNRKDQLEKHTAKHTLDLLYKCDVKFCTFTAVNKSDLVKHREIHISELEVVEYCYVCMKCEKSFFESRTVEPEADIKPRTSGASLCSECLKISSRRKSKIITFKVRNSFLVRN